MEGREVFKFAVTTMAEASRQVVKEVGLQLSDIDLFIPHQANDRIIQAAAKSLDIPREKVYINVDRYGNLSAASPPVALCEAVEEGRIKEGDLVLLVAFGAGFPWSSVPITGQTFAVLLTGALLGSRLGALSVVAYLAQGAMGLPVFAYGGGAAYFAGPTAGFLIGFVPMAFIVGYLCERAS